MRLGPEFDTLFTLVYEELRKLAYAVKRSDSSQTLNPTALVHEAWLKLATAPQTAAESPLHFKRIAARAMRQVLVDAARHRAATKRGGCVPLIELDESLGLAKSSSNDQVLALHEALLQLERVDQRRASVVEARFFGGLSVAEVAALHEVSVETVAEDWRGAKAWLGYRLRQAGF